MVWIVGWSHERRLQRVLTVVVLPRIEFGANPGLRLFGQEPLDFSVAEFNCGPGQCEGRQDTVDVGYSGRYSRVCFFLTISRSCANGMKT